MKKIQRAELKPGMRFSDSVFFDDGTNIFLSAGMELSGRELDKLFEWDIDFVMTDGSLLPHVLKNNESIQSEDRAFSRYYATPVSEEHPFFFSKTGKQLQLLLCENELYQTYLKVLNMTEQLFLHIQQRECLMARPFDQIIALIYKIMDANQPLCMSFILLPAHMHMPLAQTAVHSVILTRILARHLQLSTTDEHDLVFAALLHDVGMLRLPQAILEKAEALTTTERKIITAHVQISYQCVVNELMYTKHIGKSILDHHERWNGSGYPNGLSEERISIGGRILALVDAFLAMTQHKRYRHSVSGHKALQNLIYDKERRFDPAIIRAFIKAVGLYPIGSVVILNSGAIALVSNVCEKMPARPPVIFLLDEHGTVIPRNKKLYQTISIDYSTETELNDRPQELSLATIPDTFILKTIDPRAYTDYNNE